MTRRCSMTRGSRRRSPRRRIWPGPTHACRPRYAHRSPSFRRPGGGCSWPQTTNAAGSSSGCRKPPNGGDETAARARARARRRRRRSTARGLACSVCPSSSSTRSPTCGASRPGFTRASWRRAVDSRGSRAGRALAGPVELRVELPERVSAEVERAAYFVCSEGLANVAEYADASRARVTIAPVAAVCGSRSPTTGVAAPTRAAARGCGACRSDRSARRRADGRQPTGSGDPPSGRFPATGPT